MKSVNLLGVRVDNVSRAELEDLLSEWISGDTPHMIVTPNPEIILQAQQREAFRRILNDASISLPDGVGLRFASLALEGGDLSRQTGVETLELLAELSAKHRATLFLLGGELPRVAERSADVLMQQYPGSIIDGWDPGLIQMDEKGVVIPEHVLQRLRLAQPRILAVALGQWKQEQFIRDILPRLPSVRIAIGVGGAFDMLSGAIPRAPRWMRKSGLEWVWRLVREPRRIGRMYRASVVFPMTVVFATLKQRKFLSAVRRVIPAIFKQILGS